MLTRMRFKNWRSLKDVEINDLTPITVFIGANSSGKTNIIDALSFLRRMLRENVPDSTYFQVNQESQIRTLGIPDSEAIEIGIVFQPVSAERNTDYKLQISGQGNEAVFSETLIPDDPHIVNRERSSFTLRNGNKVFQTYVGGTLALPTVRGASEKTAASYSAYELYNYITGRWQILGEGFIPLLKSPNSSRALYDTYTLDEATQDLPIILSFMKDREPSLYAEFQSDLSWLMKHVSGFDVRREAVETRIIIRETVHREAEAPTVSVGTRRVLAMLAANYLLSMRFVELPGLVVIEEPDTALNPGLLQRFVEQLRVYASGPHQRQFILTTHNPTFLNYFKPEEVRVVSRDEEGHTHVARIPDAIKDIWLDKYGLGEVWTTNSFEGLAE